MKVNFRDCNWGEFKTDTTIEYEGKNYKTAEIRYITDDGSVGTATIADYALEEALYKKFDGEDITGYPDDTITYYAMDYEELYQILETIFGERVKFSTDLDLEN